MLYISEVYQLLLDELRVDKRGNAEDPDEFSRIARLANQEIYNKYIANFETNIENIDSLGWYKVYNYGIALTAGVGTIPADYERIIGKPRALVGTDYVNADLVTEFEHGSRQEDYLTQATLVHPTCRIGGVSATDELQIRVTPTTVTQINIDYLKALVTPYLDWYVNDTTEVVTFLDESVVAQAIPAGCTYRDGTPGGVGVTVASLTRDFRWHENDLSLLLTKLVNRAAKQLPDPLLLQTSNAEQAKSESE